MEKCNSDISVTADFYKKYPCTIWYFVNSFLISYLHFIPTSKWSTSNFFYSCIHQVLDESSVKVIVGQFPWTVLTAFMV